MSKRDTQAFLRLMNEQNTKIAQRAEAREAENLRQKSLQGDPFRIEHDKARREKWGQLRAREHLSKRPIKARHAFGSANVSPYN